jgi:hypothetical protein
VATPELTEGAVRTGRWCCCWAGTILSNREPKRRR